MPRSANSARESLWRRRLRQQPRSGLTILQFCRREGVSPAAFHAWKRRLASLSSPSLTAPPQQSAFLPVTLLPDPEAQDPHRDNLITIQLANGGRILLPIDAGIELVRQVVETVAHATYRAEDLSC